MGIARGSQAILGVIIEEYKSTVQPSHQSSDLLPFHLSVILFSYQRIFHSLDLFLSLIRFFSFCCCATYYSTLEKYS